MKKTIKGYTHVNTCCHFRYTLLSWNEIALLEWSIWCPTRCKMRPYCLHEGRYGDMGGYINPHRYHTVCHICETTSELSRDKAKSCILSPIIFRPQLVNLYDSPFHTFNTLLQVLCKNFFLSQKQHLVLWHPSWPFPVGIALLFHILAQSVMK